MNQTAIFLTPQSGIAELFTGMSSLQFFYYFIVLGESARFELGVNHVAVGDHIEYAAATGDQLCIDPENTLEFIRQTGGPWFVVSFIAVMNFYLHGISPFLLYSDGMTWIVEP